MMKRFLLLSALAACVAGCGADREAEVKVLRAQMNDLIVKHSQLLDKFNKHQNTMDAVVDYQLNIGDLEEKIAIMLVEQLESQNRINTEFAIQLQALQVRTNVLNVYSIPPAKAVNPRMRAESEPSSHSRKINPHLRQGIPISVFESIKAKAIKDWPDDFSMQESRVKREVAAYKKLNP